VTARDIRQAVATALADAGVGTYRANGGYLAGDTAPIFFSRMPSDPDRCIVVTAYPLALPYTTGVQVRCRGSAGATTSAEDLADAARAALHGREDIPGIEAMVLVGGGRIGFDAQDRDEVSWNFQAITSDPSVAVEF
jgi:hypothetical protein